MGFFLSVLFPVNRYTPAASLSSQAGAPECENAAETGLPLGGCMFRSDGTPRSPPTLQSFREGRVIGRGFQGLFTKLHLIIQCTMKLRS